MAKRVTRRYLRDCQCSSEHSLSASAREITKPSYDERSRLLAQLVPTETRSSGVFISSAGNTRLQDFFSFVSDVERSWRAALWFYRAQGLA